MQHNILIKYKNLILRQIQSEDIEKLRNWRNDSQNSRFLRKLPYITSNMQKAWYAKYLQDSDEIAFSIVENNEIKDVIGSLSLYGFHDGEAEIGKILIGNKAARGHGYGHLAFVMLLHYGFKILKLKKIFAIVDKNNIAAQKTYSKVGFEFVKCVNIENVGMQDLIQITNEKLETANVFCNDIKII